MYMHTGLLVVRQVLPRQLHVQSDQIFLQNMFFVLHFNCDVHFDSRENGQLLLNLGPLFFLEPA